MKKYDKINDILSLKWLPVEEQIQMNLEKLAFKGLYYTNLATHLQQRSSIETKILQIQEGKILWKKLSRCDQIMCMR